MNVRTYRAASIREALDLVRRELGSDAIILSTREVPAARRFPWLRRTSAAEVVAGLAEQTAPLRRSTTAARQTAQPQSILPASEPATDRIPPLPAERISTSHRVMRGEGPGVRGHNEIITAVPKLDAGQPEPTRASSPDPFDTLISQLNTIPRGRRTEVPDSLFHLYTQLIDADVDEDVARQLLLEFKTGTARDADAIQRLQSLIETQIRCTGPIPVTPGRRHVVALVGPTGVGKTTTIAKLAANFKLRERANVGLVTVDTYRVAAVEQLRTYAEIIDLPMHVVTTPAEMRAAVQSLAGMDLVLIDTAGRSPRDELKIQELRSFLGEADVDQVHLVLSLATGVRSNALTADRFRSVGVTSLLLTKLDEAAGPGAILSAAHRIQLPISYLTTGQDVPDDIEPAAPRRAAQLILSPETPDAKAALRIEDGR